MLVRTLLFLLLNFGALAIGGLLMNNGPSSDWYNTMHLAPWTPPGWVFGAAWTTIMVCFSIYMATFWERIDNKNFVIGLYSIQWVLNIFWNPLFFYFHLTFISLIEIFILTILIGYFLFGFLKEMKFQSVYMIPYFIWLIIASSLNFYAYWYN